MILIWSNLDWTCARIDGCQAVAAVKSGRGLTASSAVLRAVIKAVYCTPSPGFNGSQSMSTPSYPRLVMNATRLLTKVGRVALPVAPRKPPSVAHPPTQISAFLPAACAACTKAEEFACVMLLLE